MKYLKVFALIVMIGLSYGCVPLLLAGAGGAAGAYFYKKGELVVPYDKPYESVWVATLNAVQDRNITVEQKAKDGLSGTIKGRRAGGSGVKIKVLNKAAGTTVVKIRVGTFGDKQASLLIKQAIDRRLGSG